MDRSTLIEESLRLADAPQDVLIQTLGLAVLRSEYGFADEPSEAVRRRAGQTWLQEKHEQIRHTVCKNATVLAVSRPPNSTRIELAGALVDAVSLTFGGPIVASICAVVLVKGIESFCRD
jgi:hypothetical protein